MPKSGSRSVGFSLSVCVYVCAGGGRGRVGERMHMDVSVCVHARLNAIMSNFDLYILAQLLSMSYPMSSYKLKLTPSRLSD